MSLIDPAISLPKALVTLSFFTAGPTGRPRRPGAPPPCPALRRWLPGAVQPHRPHHLAASARGHRCLVVVVGAGAGQPGLPPPAARGRGGARRSGQGEASSTMPSFHMLLQRTLQGCSKRWAPGCVKLDEKFSFCLPSAGRRTQLFHLIFTQPGPTF